MNTKVSFLSRSKLLLLGSAFFAVSLFFGGQANAAFCTWTNSSTDGLASNLANWENTLAGDGSSCTTLTGNGLYFNGARSVSNAVFDVSTSTAEITVGSDYSGTIDVLSGVTLTATGNVSQSGGTFLVGGTLQMSGGTGDLGVGGTAFNVTGTINLAGNLVVTTTLNQTAGTLTMSGTSKTISGVGTLGLYDLTVSGSVTLARNVTTTNDLTVSVGGALNLSTFDFSSGHNIISSGTLTQTSGTVTMTSASAGVLGDGGSLSSSITLYNLVISGGGSSPMGLGSNVTTTNVLTISGVLNANAYTINLTATGTPLVVSGTFNAGTSNVVYSGLTANLTSGLTYASVTLNSGGTYDLTGNVSSTVAIANSGTFNANSYSIKFTGSGTVFVPGTFNAGTGAVDYTGTSNIASTTYAFLQADGTQTISGSLTVNQNFYIFGSVSQTTGTLTMSSSSGLLYNAGTNLTLSSLTIPVSAGITLTGSVTSTYIMSVEGNFTAGSGNVTLTNTGTPLVVSGTFTKGTSNVVYSGATANIASTTYYNLTVNNGTAGTLTGSTTVSNVLTINSSKTLDLAGFTVNLSGTGTPFVKTGTLTSSAGTVRYSGAGVTNVTAGTSYYSLAIDSTAAVLAGAVEMNNLNIGASGVLDANGYTITLDGSGTPFVRTGTFTASTSTVVYAGLSATNITSANYYNLTVSTAGTLTGNVTSTNVLTISSSKSLDGSVYTVELTGTGTPFVRTGTFTASTSTIKYSGATANIASTTYYNLTVNNGTAGTLTGSTTVSNALTINSGKTLNASSYTLTLSGSGTPVSNSGTFTSASSTVRYTNSGSVTPAAENYWDLVLGSGAYTLAGNTTSTDSFTNAGTLTIGSSYNLYAPGTYSNTGTVTESGAIIHPASVYAFVDGAGSDVTSYTASSDSVIVKVTDVDANLTTSADTLTVTLSSDTYGDSETITLTETGASTGIFQSSGNVFSVASAKTNNDGLLQVSGNGTVSLAFADSKDSSDTGSDSATFTAATVGTSGGSSGGGGVSSGAGTPPSKISVSLPGNPAVVSSKVVTLSLSAANAKDMVVSEDPTFAGASWEAFSTNKSVTLSVGDGKKTLYIKFRSPSGAVSAVYQVVVALDSASALTTGSNTNSDSATAPAVSTPVFNANPDSKVAILPVKKLQYVPNSSVAYTYTFKNETAKTLKIKVLRQVVDSNGKVVAKVNGTASIAKGKTFKSNTTNALNSKLPDGTYTVQVKVMDSKDVVLAENSFDVMVKKPLPPPSIVTNDPESKVVITGLKVDYKPGSAVKYTYSYKNETTKPVKVTIVRQVVDQNGKVVNQVTGTRTLSKGQTVKFNATSALSSKLANGTYTVKVQVLDAKKAVLAENSFDVMVKK